MTDPLFLLDPDHDDVPVDADGLDAGWQLTLPAAVRRHAFQSMRLRRGDGMQLSDGRGLRLQATAVDPESGIAQVRGFLREPRPAVRLCLVQALARNGHDEQAVDMATQLGVDRIVPWQADRSIAKWREGRSDRRWRQTAEAAVEQSRRAWTPDLDGCLTTRGLTALCRTVVDGGGLFIVLHQDATDPWSDVESMARGVSAASDADGGERTVAVAVGPEGGIAEDEVGDLVRAGARACVLGRTILRASLAGPVALALLSRAVGRFG